MVWTDISVFSCWQGVIVAPFTDGISLLELAIIAVIHCTWEALAIKFVMIPSTCLALVKQSFTTVTVEVEMSATHVQNSVIFDTRCFIVRHVIPFTTLVAFGISSFVDLAVFDNVLALVVPFNVSEEDFVSFTYQGIRSSRPRFHRS